MALLRKLGTWLWRITRKWVWLILFIPLALDFLSTMLPDATIGFGSRPIFLWLDSWNASLALLVVGILTSAFLVHLDDDKLVEDSQRKQPQIRMSLLGGDSNSNGVVSLYINRDESPDIDEMLATKRQQLLGVSSTDESKRNLFNASQLLMRTPNYRFAEELETYLQNYRTYLEGRAREKEAKNLLRDFVPVFENVGEVVASGVQIEIQVPSDWVLSDSESRRMQAARDYGITSLTAPTPPEPYKDAFADLGKTLSGSGSVWLAPSKLPPIALVELSDTEVVRNGATTSILYELERIVPKQCVRENMELRLWFGCVNDTGSVKIRYLVRAAELPEPYTGELTIQFVLGDDNENP